MVAWLIHTDNVKEGNNTKREEKDQFKFVKWEYWNQSFDKWQIQLKKDNSFMIEFVNNKI